MAVLYLNQDGEKLRVKHKRLIVEYRNEKIFQIPVIKVEDIIVVGNVEITPSALHLIAKNGISTCFISKHGNFYCKIQPAFPKNVYIRLQQYEKSRDKNFCVRFARCIICGKIYNQRALLYKYYLNHKNEEIVDSLKKLKSVYKQIARATNIQTILGQEGRASSVYFQTLGKIVPDDFKFNRRTKRPPEDMFNSLLSFGYTLLYNEIITAILTSALDPYVGFMHKLEYGRASLAVDLMEEFRVPVIDSLVLALVNKKIIKKEHFVKKYRGYYLTDKGRKLFFKHYEQKLNSTPPSTIENEFVKFQGDDTITFRKLFIIQCRNFAKTIIRQHIYSPFKIKI